MMQMGFKEWFMINPPIISTILVFSRCWWWLSRWSGFGCFAKRPSFRGIVGTYSRVGAGEAAAGRHRPL
jgi:hypothetical protein